MVEEQTKTCSNTNCTEINPQQDDDEELSFQELKLIENIVKDFLQE